MTIKMELGEESQVLGQGLRAIVYSNQAIYKVIDSSDSHCTLGLARVRVVSLASVPTSEHNGKELRLLS